MRTRYKELVIPALYGSTTYPLQVHWKMISDVNNGKARPNSPCDIRSSKVNMVPTTSIYGWQGLQNVPARLVNEFFHNVHADEMTKFSNAAAKKIADAVDDVAGSFSSLNFMWELREIGSTWEKAVDLFSGKGGIIERLRRNVTYTEWAFNIRPMISDSVALMRKADERARTLNSKLSGYRVPIPISWGYSKQRNFSNESWSAFPGQSLMLTGESRIMMRVNGEIRLSVPTLARANPQLWNVLETLAIDISPEVIWEAMPWSWLVDWFTPVGLGLQFSGTSIMKPQPWFSGVITYKNRSNASVIVGSGGNYHAGQYAGHVYAKNYKRDAFNGPAASMITWGIFPQPNLHRIAIMRDILAGRKRQSPSRKPKTGSQS